MEVDPQSEREELKQIHPKDMLDLLSSSNEEIRPASFEHFGGDANRVELASDEAALALLGGT